MMEKTYVSRKFIAVAASFALGAGALCTYSLRADDNMGGMAMTKMDKMAKDHMEVISPDDQRAAMDTLDKIKQMAADPAQADTMKSEMAKMMVMQHMSRELAMNADFQKASMDTMNDPNVKKIHDDADTTAKDPDQMKNLKMQIVNDPMAMKMVVHQAIMMNMMHERMGEIAGKMPEDKK
jgi:hypothetical protein